MIEVAPLPIWVSNQAILRASRGTRSPLQDLRPADETNIHIEQLDSLLCLRLHEGFVQGPRRPADGQGRIHHGWRSVRVQVLIWEPQRPIHRSEERRVGKECRSQWT